MGIFSEALRQFGFMPAGPDPQVEAARIQAQNAQDQRDHDADMAQGAAAAAMDLAMRRSQDAAFGRRFSAGQARNSQEFSAQQKSIDRQQRAAESSQARRDRAAEFGAAREDKERARQAEVQMVYDKLAAEERMQAEQMKLKKAQMGGKKRIDVMKAAGMPQQNWGHNYRWVSNADPDYYDFDHERI